MRLLSSVQKWFVTGQKQTASTEPVMEEVPHQDGDKSLMVLTAAKT